MTAPDLFAQALQNARTDLNDPAAWHPTGVTRTNPVVHPATANTTAAAQALPAGSLSPCCIGTGPDGVLRTTLSPKHEILRHTPLAEVMGHRWMVGAWDEQTNYVLFYDGRYAGTPNPNDSELQVVNHVAQLIARQDSRQQL